MRLTQDEASSHHAQLGATIRQHMSRLISRLRRWTPTDTRQLLVTLPILLWKHFVLKRPLLLIIRSAGIGDIICTFPSVATLKHDHPHAIIVYATKLAYVNLLPRSLVDFGVDLYSILPVALEKLLNPRWVFRPRTPDDYRPRRARQKIHLAEEMRKSFGLPELMQPSFHVQPNPAALRAVEGYLDATNLRGKRLVILHTGPTWPVKEWSSEEKWSRLAHELRTRHEVIPIQIGEDLSALGDARRAQRAGGAIDWVGKLTFDETLALLSIAQLFVGIDSGPLHMAGMVNLPCVGLFGPTDGACFLPRDGRSVGVSSHVACLGCHHNVPEPGHWQNGCPHDILCMKELTVEDVLKACESVLAEKRTERPVV